MPGLFGYYQRLPAPAGQAAQRLSRMLAPVRQRHPVRVSQWGDERFAGRNQRFVDRFTSVPMPEAGTVVLLDGYLIDRGAIVGELRRLGEEADERWDDEALAGLLYRHLGERVVDHLRGSYNLCAYDPSTTRLTLISGPYGERHLFVRVGEESVAFGSQAKALAALDSGRGRPCWLAVHEMLNFGYIGATRTLFDDIELLPGATVLSVDPAGVTRRRYWDLHRPRPPRPPAVSDLVEDAGPILQRAVDRQLERFPDAAVPLSGGLDSRTILAFASRRGRSLDALHVAWYPREEDIARRLCAQAGGRWHRWDPLQLDAAEALAEGMEISDGTVHCHQFWFLPVVRQLAAAGGPEALLDGYLMDVLLGDTFLELPRRGPCGDDDRRAIINRLWRRGHPAFVRKAFLPGFYRDYEEANRASIAQGMSGIDAEPISDFVHRFSLAHRSNRYSVALPNVDRQYLEYGYPGLDPEVAELYRVLPPACKAGARFYRQVLLRHAPPFARIAWAKTGRPLTAGKGWLTSVAGRVPLRQLAALPLLRASGGHIDLAQRGDWNRRFRRDAGFRGVFTGVLEDPRTWTRGMIDRRGVERLIGCADRGWPVLSLIQSLVTIELWFRRYVDG